jgi:hypothetical protein
MQNKNRITEFLNKVKDSEVNSEQSAFVFSCDSKFGESENSGSKCTNSGDCSKSYNRSLCVNSSQTCESSTNTGECENISPVEPGGGTVTINITVQEGCGCK